MINVFNSPIEASSLDEFHRQRGDKKDTVFDDERRKPQVQYMEDGRKKIDGIVEQQNAPNALWTTTISRGVANEWRNQAEGTSALQRARKYVQNLTYDCRLFLHEAARDYGTPFLLLFNAILVIIALYVFKVIVW